MSQPPPSSMPKLGPEGQAASGTPIPDTASVPSVAAAPVLPTSTLFTWHGSPWALTGACLINAILMVLTVGIYGFWGRTEIRRRMWSSVRLNGEPLAYHGTPLELLKGFFAVMLVVLVPLFLLGMVVVVFFGQASAVFGVYQIALFLGIYPVLAAIAFYRARRYRLSRTSWRGVRGSIDGSSTSYGFLSWATAWAYPFTLGWIAPYRAVTLQRKLVADTQLGDRRLQFNGSSSSLYGPFALLWFGTVVLYFAVFGVFGWVAGAKVTPQNPMWWTRLSAKDWAEIVAVVMVAIVLWSIMSSFYYARLYNLVARSTSMTPSRTGDPPLSFQLDVRGMKLIWLFVTNSLLTYLSVYILRPVATARSMKYFVEHLQVVGPFDPASIGQNRSILDQSGEGLGQAFDLDAF